MTNKLIKKQRELKMICKQNLLYIQEFLKKSI